MFLSWFVFFITICNNLKWKRRKKIDMKKKKVTWKHTHSTNEHSYNFIKEKLLSIDLHMNYTLYFFRQKLVSSQGSVYAPRGRYYYIISILLCSNCWWFLYKIYNLVTDYYTMNYFQYFFFSSFFLIASEVLKLDENTQLNQFNFWY